MHFHCLTFQRAFLGNLPGHSIYPCYQRLICPQSFAESLWSGSHCGQEWDDKEGDSRMMLEAVLWPVHPFLGISGPHKLSSFFNPSFNITGLWGTYWSRETHTLPARSATFRMPWRMSTNAEWSLHSVQHLPTSTSQNFLFGNLSQTHSKKYKMASYAWN